MECSTKDEVSWSGGYLIWSTRCKQKGRSTIRSTEKLPCQEPSSHHRVRVGRADWMTPRFYRKCRNDGNVHGYNGHGPHAKSTATNAWESKKNQ